MFMYMQDRRRDRARDRSRDRYTDEYRDIQAGRIDIHRRRVKMNESHLDLLLRHTLNYAILY